MIFVSTTSNNLCFSFHFVLFIYPDPLQRLNLSPPVKAHAFVTLGKLCPPNEYIN